MAAATAAVQVPLSVCQAGAGSVKMGGHTVKDSGYSNVVQDVLESAVQQSLVNTASVGSSASGETSRDSHVCYICSIVLKNTVSLRKHIRGADHAIKSHHCNTRAIPKVSGLDIFDRNIFHNLYISETYILYEL